MQHALPVLNVPRVCLWVLGHASVQWLGYSGFQFESMDYLLEFILGSYDALICKINQIWEARNLAFVFESFQNFRASFAPTGEEYRVYLLISANLPFSRFAIFIICVANV